MASRSPRSSRTWRPTPSCSSQRPATTAEMQAAIDWFAINGVHIITRSLGAPYDGPGDGTGPLDTVVDYAAAHGITWFNSGGNDAAFGYGRFTDGVGRWLRRLPQRVRRRHDAARRSTERRRCLRRHPLGNDWYLPPNAVTDYSVEVWQGTSESSATFVQTFDDPQINGAPPLEVVDEFFTVGAPVRRCSCGSVRAPTTCRRRRTRSRWPPSTE